MRIISTVIFIALCQSAFAQIDIFGHKKHVIDTQDYIRYYPFYEGVQLIQIEHNRLFTDQVRSFDPWESCAMSSAPPSYYILMSHPYEHYTFIFRDTYGTILNCFPSRTYKNQFKLKTVDSCTTTYHNSPEVNKINLGYYAPAYRAPRAYVIRNAIGKFGLMDTLGRVQVKPQFDTILQRSGSYLVRSGKQWGLINQQFELVFKTEYTSVAPLHKNKFLVESGKCFGVVDPSGKSLIAIKYNSIKFLKAYPDLYTFTHKGKLGVMDSSFRIVQPPAYQSVSRLGRLYLVTMPDQKHFGVMDMKGELLLQPIYSEIRSLGSYNFSVRLFNTDSSAYKYGLYDWDGVNVLPVKYDEIRKMGHYHFRVGLFNRDSGVFKYGLYDRQGVQVLPVEYDEIFWERRKVQLIIRKGKEQFKIDRNGKRIEE